MPKGLEDMLLSDEADTDEDVTTEEDENEESDDEEESDDDEELREAGKKALQAERKRVRELERELKRLKAQQDKGKAKQEDQLRAQVRSEVAREFGKELATEKAIAALSEAGYKGNPARGAKLIDLDDLIDDDGKVDAQALRDVVSEWQDDEPNLFGDSPVRRRSSGSADLGKKKVSRAEKDPLAEALGSLVGRPELA